MKRSLADYRNTFTPTVQTPGGLTCRIRSLRVGDFLALGNVPDIFAPLPGEDEPARKERVVKAMAGQSDKVHAMTKATLISCVTILDEKNEVKVIDNDRTPKENEFCFNEFTPVDVNFLVSEINKLSEIGGEAATEAAKFPKE